MNPSGFYVDPQIVTLTQNVSAMYSVEKDKPLQTFDLQGLSFSFRTQTRI